MKKLTALTLLLLTAFLLVGCGGSEPDAPADVRVESVDLFIMESFPVQVRLLIRGQLADGCVFIRAVEQTRVGKTFNVTIVTEREPDAVCTMALVPFQEPLALEVIGLEAGDYTVNVHGQSADFRLDIDNIIPDIGENPAATVIILNLSRELEVAPEEITILNVREVEWPDNCLGVALPDVACAEVITPGYVIELEVNGITMVFHTNENGAQIIMVYAID